MTRLELLQRLSRPADTKMLLYVIDGVGGLPHPGHGRTELEQARIPQLDAFCRRAITGRTVPVGTGIPTGSGPGHLALFGYPPTEGDLPRGVLEVLGADRVYRRGERLDGDFELRPGDLAARCNFALVEPGTLVVRDRRGGSPSDERNEELVRTISASVAVEGVEIYLFPGRQHRFAAVFRAPGLSGPLTDTDPLAAGRAVLPPQAESAAQGRSVEVVTAFMSQVHDILGATAAPNYALLRGIGTQPHLPTLQDLYGISAAAVAVYPMYRGIARLVGMTVLDTPDRAAQLEALRSHFDDFDLFFVHIKETDTFGHKGDFDGKVAELEQVDAHFGRCLDLPFDVVAVTGDHCTPTLLKEHSHHPVPTAVWSGTCMWDRVESYHERAVTAGGLGQFPASHLLGYMLAEAGRVVKFGA